MNVIKGIFYILTHFNKRNILFLLNLDKRVITLHPHDPSGRRALVSYIKESVLWNESDRRFDGHSNKWESREVVNIFLDMGYVVDIVAWSDTTFVPRRAYDVVFDIYTNMQRWAPSLGKQTKKILHLTGSYPVYQNVQEEKRIEGVWLRKGVRCQLRRHVKDVALAEKSIQIADGCTLIGNQHTIETYPSKYHYKILPLSVTASPTFDQTMKMATAQKEFLWYSGTGAVHKGLDLVLEVFFKHPEWKLHIVGDIDAETDILSVYGKEFLSSSIIYHGRMNPRSKLFHALIKQIGCVISPSCSEGMSGSVATCMWLGLFPIISRDTGIDLPSGCGVYLEQCTVEEIENAVTTVVHMPEKEFLQQRKIIAEYASVQYSRKRFSTIMRSSIQQIII